MHLSDLPEVVADEAKACEFNIAAACWASLRRDGKERIRAVDLSQRVISFKWLLKMMGIPAEPFIIEQFGDDEDPSPHLSSVCSTLLPDGSYALSRFRPASELPAGPKVHRPQSVLHRSFSFAALRTLSGDHIDRLQNFHPVEGSAETAIAPLLVEESVSQKKVRSIFEGLCGKLLGYFTQQEFADLLKESALTGVITSFTRIRHEAAVLEPDEAYLDRLDYIIKGLSAVKLFLRQVRNFKSVKNLTLQKVSVFKTSLPLTLEFLHDSNIAPHPILHHMDVRTKFLEHFEAHHSLSEALTFVIDECAGNEILDASSFSELTGPRRTSVEQWMRILLCP